MSSKNRILILGYKGMLGSMVYQYFKGLNKYVIGGTTRTEISGTQSGHIFILDAANNAKLHLHNIFSAFKPNWVINCIGVTKPDIECKDESVKNAIMVNSIFPYELKEAASLHDCKVITIATDCVFSGKKGHYYEPSTHDAEDVYGKSKSLGELPGFFTLRTSIIGPEYKSDRKFLLEWVGKSIKNKTEINGYLNHYWNGITTLAFAKLCHGLISHYSSFYHLNMLHVFSEKVNTKGRLIKIIAKKYFDVDYEIKMKACTNEIDRVLCTMYHDQHLLLWQKSGYDSIPDIDFLLQEMKNFNFIREEDVKW